MSNKILVAKKATLSGDLTVSFKEQTKLIPGAYPEHIIISGDMAFISKKIITSLTPALLSGSILCIRDKEFKVERPQQMYYYVSETFNPIQHMYKQLMHKEVTHQGISMNFYQATKGYRGHLEASEYTALQEYNQELIERIRLKNRFNYQMLERFYKILGHHSPISIQLPSLKAYLEVQAEKQFIKDLPTTTEKLTELQILELQHDAKYYGVETKQLFIQFLYHKTKQGFTEEPTLISAPLDHEHYLPSTFYEKGSYNTPYQIRLDARPKALASDQPMVEAYHQLQYFKSLGTEFLIPGAHICPICKQLYMETEGCQDHVQPISFVSAEKLFYGTDHVYQDRDISIEE